MKSKAQVAGHPLHPILIAFPIAFLYGGLGFDAAAYLLGWHGGRATGAYLSVAAIVSGLIAGVPGFIDYLYAVPPESSAKDRAWSHLLINLAALAIYAAGWAFRDRATFEPGLGTLLLELGGVGLVTWGGWLGGTLVYREQIAVDHMSANAKTVIEATVDPSPTGTTVVARADELIVDQMKLIHIGGRRVVLARTEEGYRAFDDRCSHKGASMADGVMICGTVHCPWHGSRFDATTGAVKAGPAKEPIETYPVDVIGGEVRLTLPAMAASG